MSMLEGLLRRDIRVPRRGEPEAVVAEAHGVSFSYGGAFALRDVDLTVRAGRVLALVGPNGAGKSTLLGVLAGDHKTHGGSVTIDGAAPREWSPNELALRRAVLLQRSSVTFPFTVREIVGMGRAPWTGTDTTDDDETVIAAALAEADLEGFEERVYTTLSGGERARADLARALVQDAIVLLLDEPAAAMDVRHQELVFGVLERRARRGDAIVVVMHDLALAAAYADDVVLMVDGRVRAAGPPDEVLTEALLSEVYEHPIEVFPHPRTGAPVIQAHRPLREEHT